MQCNHCNRQIPDGSPFCPRCGAALEQGATVLQQAEPTPRPPREERPRRERQARPERPRRERAPRPERPRRERTPRPEHRPGSINIMRQVIYYSLAVLCIIPMCVGEYRRIVEMDGKMDATYWFLLCPVLLSVFFLFLAIGVPELERVQAQERERDERGEYYQSRLGETACNALAKILIPFGIVCFLISGLMWLIAGV